MIRNAMFGLSLLALTTGSAFAGSAKHHAKPVVVAEAKTPAADTAAPADKPADKADKTDKKVKKVKKEKAPKAEGKTEGAKEMAPTPAPAK